jgi:hypothetical protein
VKWTIALAVMLSAVALASAGSAKEPTFEPGCDASSDIKTSGEISAIEVTGVGGPASQMLTIHLSDNNTYYSRADASAGMFAGYVALFTSAYFNKKPVTIHYGCEVGMRVIHFVNLP